MINFQYLLHTYTIYKFATLRGAVHSLCHGHHLTPLQIEGKLFNEGGGGPKNNQMMTSIDKNVISDVTCHGTVYFYSNLNSWFGIMITQQDQA